MPLPPWFWDDDPLPITEDVVFAVEKPLPDKQSIIDQLLNTPGGRQKLAASMAAPLRTRRDYAAIGRKTFLVEQIPVGALPIYDKEPCHTVVSVGRDHPAVSSTQP